MPETVGQLARWSRRLVCLMLLLAPSRVFADHYSFKHYGPDEGLTTAVNGLLQDRDGFLWVQTANGLFRYDGDRFQRFAIKEGLPSLQIRHLRQSLDGDLWVVTGAGLARFRHNRFERVLTVLADGPEEIFGLDSDSRGRLFVGTAKGLLLGERSPAGAFRFRLAEGTRPVSVDGVFVEPAGAVWYGCARSLCRWQGGHSEIFGAGEGLPRDNWSAILRDRDGALWVRGVQHLYVLPPGARQFVARDSGLPPATNSAIGMTFDRTGVALVATDLGLARWVDGKWTLIGGAQGLDSDAVSSVLEDREGSLWIGLWGAGLARWLGYGEWTSWTKADGLGNNIVWAIQKDRSEATFVGTDNGLVRLGAGDKGGARLWTTGDGLGGNKIKAIVSGAGGELWIGSSPGGISRLDPETGRIRRYGVESGLEEVHVIALHIDPENRLWVSTPRGLFRSTRLDGTVSFERQTPPSTTGYEFYFRFMGDRLGRTWVGSMLGLLCWDHGRWTRYTTADGLKSNGVTHVAETPDGAIWVAYREPMGITRIAFRGGKPHVNHVTRADDSNSDYVLFLGVDSMGALWVGTDDGVDVHRNGAWSHIGRDDGLVWDDCAANGFLAEPDGTVWIGTLKGLSRYHPSGRSRPALDPRAIVTSVTFGKTRTDALAVSDIPFPDHSLLVQFAGLTFRRERDVRFRYRLAGLEDGWTQTALHEARFPSLPAGRYRFEVSARNADGRWSAEPARVPFRILPPWWETWWFRGSLLCALAFAVRLLWRWRTRSLVVRQSELEAAVGERTAELQHQHDLVETHKGEIEELLKKSQEISRLKSEFLANMSHEIRTPMNGVIGMTQLALNTRLDEEQREYVATIGDSASALLGIINDILDFSKIEAGKLELAREPLALRECIADALRSVAVKAHEKGLELTWRVPRDVPDALVGDAGRLRQIILNLVGNATKFTERGEIAIEVTLEPPQPKERAITDSRLLRFSVHDTGIGIPAEKRALIFEAFAQADGSSTRKYGGTGLGLAICSQLVALMDGKIWVDSSERGSTFYFTARFGAGVPAPAPAMLPGEPVALLVDDNATNRSLLLEMLDGWGVRAKPAPASGTLFDEPPPAFAIVDAFMPGEDTVALVHRILERVPANRVILLTTTGHNRDYDRLRQMGIAKFVAKPVNPAELYPVLCQMLVPGSPDVGATAAAQSIAESTRPLRILLAEDNVINQRVAQRLLHKMGHAVELAVNGRVAVEKASHAPFDLILMDVQMPEMDGFEATAALRKMGMRAPIVAMTAHAMSGDREECLSAGMDDYIAKPVVADSLAALIEKVCGLRQPAVEPLPTS